MLTASLVSEAVSAEVLKERVSSCLMGFLMRLNPAFKGIRSSILHRNIGSIEEVLAELIREETRLRAQAKLDVHSSDSGSVFAVQQGPPQFGRTPLGVVICYHCKEPGHIQVRCPERVVCSYCKAAGHVIGDCHILAQRGRGHGGRSGSSPSAGRGYSAPRAPPGVSYATTPFTLITVAAGSASSSGVFSAEIRRLVQEALQESLPSAVTAAFSTGHEDGEGDRARE
ncbi:unnamed protein product [Linum trigynum]|uniref:CCHC-type domain-containing protein n=1 Tax=Linum trigynum TaxID=586398 RepID=A0AAV2GR62_9ROSI